LFSLFLKLFTFVAFITLSGSAFQWAITLWEKVYFPYYGSTVWSVASKKREGLHGLSRRYNILVMAID
jgi:hypothetical protein